jgi:hypothetical protein
MTRMRRSFAVLSAGRGGRPRPVQHRRAAMSEGRTADSQTYLKGVAFPASKLDVIAIAEANGAPQAAIDSLQRVKCEQFRSAQAVAAALLTAKRARRREFEKLRVS